MKCLADNPLRYVVFAVLLLYATTADFMATSVLFVDGNNDCNHPWVRVEHKCVTDSAELKNTHQSPLFAPIAASVIPVVVLYHAPDLLTHRFIQVGHVAVEHSVTPTDTVSLRC